MSITGKNNQDNYEFIFEDNGPGIPEDLLTRVTKLSLQVMPQEMIITLV